MKISGCMNPQRVYNKYSNEYVYAPCGRCPECLKRKSLEWTERLTQERYCWRYCLFFTLTYDNDHVPVLKHDTTHTYLFDLSTAHQHPVLGGVFIDRADLMDKLTDVERIRLNNWIDGQPDGVKYLSVGDAQRFVKRVRSSLSRKVKSKISYDRQNSIKSSLTDRDAKIRYFLCGEYGETTCRPHYHGIFFFNSEFTASCIEEVIREVWPFGAVNSSFVAESNASYVAGYVNCSYNLPQVLLHERIRPFALFSRRPFIGSLCHSTEKVKEIFFSASPDHVIFDHKRSAFDNVPLWRSYQRLLYPKISGFSNLSHHDRVNLYRAFERYEKITDNPNFPHFCEYVRGLFKSVYCPTLYPEYVESITRDETDVRLITQRIRSWYYISSRVCEQARSFGIPVRMYVSIIERYYDNCARRQLKNQYEYEEELVDRNRLDNAFALDLEFVRTCCSLELDCLTAHEIETMESFGIDVTLFYDDDLDARRAYRAKFLPVATSEYRDLCRDSVVWLRDHVKNKAKNDYLMNHPELYSLIWSCDTFETLDYFPTDGSPLCGF